MKQPDPSTQPGQTAVTQRVLAAGDMYFGRYRLLRVLGRGGMGIVWLARDESLDTEVALKMLPEILRWDPTGLQQLKEETKRARSLTHANIVRIHDFVEAAEQVAISMEYVDGSSLSALRARNPAKAYSHEELFPWIMELCAALQYAHEVAKVVHRDLKPANVLVSQDGHIKVADFGLARSLQDANSRVTQLNTSGTLLYMSPQQLWGETAVPTDDIYSLGVTLYELLAGQTPFYTGDLSRQIARKKPESINRRRERLGITGLPPVPQDWEDCIQECIAKTAKERPQSVALIAERFQDMRDKEVCRVRLGRQLSRVAKLGPVVLGAFVLGALSVLGVKVLGTASHNEVLYASLDQGASPVGKINWKLSEPQPTDEWSADRHGAPRGAFQLNGFGSQSFVSEGGWQMDPAKPFAVSLWLKPSSLSGLNGMLIMHPETLFRGFEWNIAQANGCLYFTLRPHNAYGVELMVPMPVDAHAWLHMAMVYTPEEALVYLNGVLAARAPHALRETTLASTATRLLLGRPVPDHPSFIGALDELKLFDRVPSEAELKALAADGPPPPSTAVNFALTKGIYPDTADIEECVRKEFGPKAEVADWTEIKALHGAAPKAFVESLPLTIDRSAYVTRAGLRTIGSAKKRQFFIQAFEGAVPEWFLAHDAMAQGELTLGSWYGTTLPVLARIGNQPLGLKWTDPIVTAQDALPPHWGFFRWGAIPAAGLVKGVLYLREEQSRIVLFRDLSLRDGADLAVSQQCTLGAAPGASGVRVSLELADGRRVSAQLGKAKAGEAHLEMSLEGVEGAPRRLEAPPWFGAWDISFHARDGLLSLQANLVEDRVHSLSLELPVPGLTMTQVRRLTFEPYTSGDTEVLCSAIAVSVSPAAPPQ